ncbi:MAG: winged helix-turn-helix transcriptional regulator [Caulobacteraceae bacterium]|nr:winged helix-turn-helix transcriptional regulator [Caulobacteraceae bacterium]
MKDGPNIAGIAALIGDPARANVLTALIDGRALTVSELAQAAGVGLPTASGHLAKLAEAGLIEGERQGRHRYFRLSGPDVAQALEALMGLAERTGARRVRTGPREPALRQARACYDHLAGETAVAMFDALVARGVISADDEPELTASGEATFRALGVDLEVLKRSSRPLCRRCLDWSERRAHLGGALGAAILERLLATEMARRGEGRHIHLTPAGMALIADGFAASSLAAPLVSA